MASKKKEKHLADYYVTAKDIKNMKKRGSKTSYIRMTLDVIEMNKDIMKNRKSKFPNL
jgi:hypothetical protein